MDSKPINRKLLLCYISGLDLRRINAGTTPFISGALDLYPKAYIRNLPSNDLLPTILTGTYPTEHGMWGVKLKNNTTESFSDKLTDLFPDIVTTSVQCLLHFFTNSFDLAAIPPKRRRLFELKRTKYHRRTRLTDALLEIGGIETCLGVLGKSRARYLYSNSSDPIKNVVNNIGSGLYQLEILELYSLDLIQQWNLDTVQKVRDYYGRIDEFLNALSERCKENGIVLALLSDHGHEEIKGSIDIKRELSGLTAAEDEYTFFIDVSMVRFWFRTVSARREILSKLAELENVTLLTSNDLNEYHISFADSRYGEVFFLADPGYIFFPHDFYQPVANLYLALSDPRQRGRLKNPRHRGTHGYLPHHDSERAFMIVFDERCKAGRQQIDIIDVAPSILAILGYPRPDSMRGSPVFSYLNRDSNPS
jgi:predicted AlkP superfamily pyrophosphatase or phosphodiesterase